MMQDVRIFMCCRPPELILYALSQVDEKRTPLQLSMDELAQKLSFLSFGVIGVICLIGMWQQRPWLDMFTIAGMYQRL
jgi:Ca2+-transporting ATPase